MSIADEEEQERWLEETGLSILVSGSEEGLVDAKALLSTLSRAQTDTVRRRINTYHQTMRKKNKHHVRDVRDIFDAPEVCDLVNGSLNWQLISCICSTKITVCSCIIASKQQ